MFNKKIVLISIIVIISISVCGTSSAFLFFGDDSSDDFSNIQISGYKCYCNNYSNEFYTNSVEFTLSNFSCENNVDVVTSFYSGNDLVKADCQYDYKEYEIDEDYNVDIIDEAGMELRDYKSDNSTQFLDFEEVKNPSDNHEIFAEIDTKNYHNITHVKIEIIDLHEHKVLFNTTKSFNISEVNLVEGEFYDVLGYGSDVHDYASEENNEPDGVTHVGSIKSGVFHYPTCYKAERIEPGDKIEFISREDAIDAGYAPCDFCNP